MRHLARLLAAAALSSLVLAPAGGGYVIRGVPWPGETITYVDRTSAGTAVRDAVRAWNSVGAGIRFARVRDARSADVEILDRRGTRQAHTTVGYRPAGAKIFLSRDLRGPEAAAAVAHELGHVLGLHHEGRRCAVMNPTPALRCASSPCRTRHCLVRPDDKRGLVELYRKRRPGMLPPPVLEASVDVGAPVLLRWRSPDWAHGRLVLIRSVRGAGCPAAPHRGPGALDVAFFTRGAEQFAPLPAVGRGSWCTGIWVQAHGTELHGTPVFVRYTVS
jgi:hypothetical protein